nr:MAG: hypothetical protein [Betatorquevirus sp.]
MPQCKTTQRNNTDGDGGDRGKRSGDTTPTLQPPQGQATQLPTANPPTNAFRIIGCKNKVTLFDCKTKHKNRRITGPDFQTELELAAWMHRPPRYYHDDKPFYPWLPPTPIVPVVNFDLNYKQ